ncbi:MAG: energy-coupling factor transporter transmembrane protein EcfT [Halobacteriaceae archaeon]
MIAYQPGDSPAHGLDPRTKLALQAAVGVAAVAHTTPRGLAALALVTGVVLAGAHTPPTVLVEFRALLPFVVGAPLFAGASLGPPWFDPAAAAGPAMAVVRMLLLLLVSAAYVRTTSARESRAAVQWLLPGRVGTLAGVGVGLVFRLLPVSRDDLGRIRLAMRARLAGERRLDERARLIGVTGLRRAFRRSDALALALRARCFAYNPTLPPLAFGRADAPGLVAAALLMAVAAV